MRHFKEKLIFDEWACAFCCAWPAASFCSRHSFHLSTHRCTKGISTTALLETCITFMGIAAMTTWTLPEQGCTAQDTPFHPETAAGGAAFSPEKVEILRSLKYRHYTEAVAPSKKQSCWRHQDTQIRKLLPHSLLFSPWVVMFRNASIWISLYLLSVWGTSDAIHPAYLKTFACEKYHQSPL